MRGVTTFFIQTYLHIRFQLTRLMRGVTTDYPITFHFPIFQLTRLMRGVTQVRSGIISYN